MYDKPATSSESIVRISEIFYSVQGEGTLVGVPSIFIRTSGCNLRCTWCDTPYASWKPEGSYLSIAEIISAIGTFPARHVVVTGGEPMIAPAITDLTAGLRSAGLHITIETAGTVTTRVSCDLVSISPKLLNSTPFEREAGIWATQHERIRYQPEILMQLMDSFDYQLKFVVSSAADLDEISSICERVEANRAKVILMPEGTSRSVINERSLWLVEICKERGFRFSPRLHIDLWGDRRGV